MNRFSIAFGAMIMAIALTGCSGMTETEQRTLSGAALGAASGYIYDQTKQNEKRAYEQGVRDGRSQQ